MQLQIQAPHVFLTYSLSNPCAHDRNLFHCLNYTKHLVFYYSTFNSRHPFAFKATIMIWIPPSHILAIIFLFIKSTELYILTS